MLKQRVITALIAAPIAIFVFLRGSWLFSAAMTLLALVAWHEFCQMSETKKVNSFPSWGAGLILLVMGAAQFGEGRYVTFVVFISIAVFLSAAVIGAPRITFTDSLYAVVGVLYIGMAFSHFMWLRFLEPETGLKFFALTVLGTWACDTFAYFFGIRFGVHKLCPTVSPAKSIEGALAGFIGCIGLVGLVGFSLAVPLWLSLVTGAIVGVLCQLGDLVESALKRHMGVKDSGGFFPGHGGVLDRLDSLMFSIPAVYYFLIFFVGA